MQKRETSALARIREDNPWESSMPEAAKERIAENLVTSENHGEFVAKKLGLEVVPPAEAKKDAEQKVPETKAEASPAPAPHADDAEHETDPEIKPVRKGNPKIEKRFSELTKARKEAEAKAEANAAEVVRERQAREAAEARAAEIEAKYNPPKPDELGPEPQASQFSDVGEYAKALKEYTAEKTRRDDAAKKAEEESQAYTKQVLSRWTENLEAARKDIPDFDATLKASTVMISDQVRDAIMEMEGTDGAKILHHFAKEPAEAERIGKMTVGAALRELGKLQARLGGGTASPSSKSTDGKPNTVTAGNDSAAQVSRAPAPISPLKGASAPADSPVDAQGVFHGTYAEWKAGRKKGTIK